MYKRQVSWLLFLLATAVFLVSIPVCWLGVRIANQEYWHLWHDDVIISDVEFNGVPVSLGEAVNASFQTLLVFWCVAACILIVSYYIHPRGSAVSTA